MTVAYVNSNIHPRGEYEHRLDTLRIFLRDSEVPLLEGVYDAERWERVVGIHGYDARADRCRACYALRFEEVARLAVEGRYDAISTTLSISPYQYTSVIAEELERAARAQGIMPLFRDFRECYPEATRRSRELGMYRQNYCGCRYSEDEARLERIERKKARKEARARRASASE